MEKNRLSRDRTIAFRRSSCKELRPITELNGVSSLCCLYDSLVTPDNGVNPSDCDHYGRMVELCFIFSLICCPFQDTIYQYYVDTNNKSYVDKLPRAGATPPSDALFYKLMVPWVDTVHYNFLVRVLVTGQYPVLMTGPVGRPLWHRAYCRGWTPPSTIYQYYVDTNNKSYVDKLQGLALLRKCSIYKLMVPWVDTVHYNFLVRVLVTGQYPVIDAGPVGRPLWHRAYCRGWTPPSGRSSPSTCPHRWDRQPLKTYLEPTSNFPSTYLELYNNLLTTFHFDHSLTTTVL
ncbi:unnamed protein product, partial [Coregonus sp. 'balchen']